VRAVILTRDGGDGGAAVEFAKGEAVAVLRTVSGGWQEEGRAHGCVEVVRGRVGRRDGRTAGGGNAAMGGRGDRATARHGPGGWHRILAGGRGWRRCRATAAGGGTCAALTLATDMRDLALVGPGGSDGVRGEHDSATRR
jgi:hypothetical protein